MRSLSAIIFLIFSLNFSFSQSAVLDFRKLEWPEYADKDSFPPDVLIRKDDRYLTKELYGGFFTTDKETYEKGEAVILTIENKDDSPLYIYPTYEEAMRMLAIFEFDEKMKKELLQTFVSEAPLIFAMIKRNHSKYAYLSFGGLDEKMAKEFGRKGFEKPLDTGEKMVLTIYPPEEKGTYRFMAQRFSHDPESIGYWGSNRYIFSNSFTVD